jgi:hypothetical protein
MAWVIVLLGIVSVVMIVGVSVSPFFTKSEREKLKEHIQRSERERHNPPLS